MSDDHTHRGDDVHSVEAAERDVNLFFGLSRRKFTEKEISEIATYVSEAVTKCLADPHAAPTGGRTLDPVRKITQT
jgi:hypothetical protein